MISSTRNQIDYVGDAREASEDGRQVLLLGKILAWYVGHYNKAHTNVQIGTLGRPIQEEEI